MINFFRKIRKKLLEDNKVVQYLTYALGEIVLIVAGILIALSINNWNNNQINEKQESKLFVQIINDLETDREKLQILLSRFERFDSTHIQVLKEIHGNSQFDPRIPYFTLRQGSRFNPLISANFKNSLTTIRNLTAREAINRYMKQESITLEAIGFSNKLRRGVLRSFLMEHDIINTEYLYQSEDLWTAELINYEKLKLQYGSVKLKQMLGNLHLDNDWAQVNISYLIELNEWLIEILQQTNTKG